MAKVNMEFVGGQFDKAQNLGFNGQTKFEVKSKAQTKRNDKINPIIYLVKKKQIMNEQELIVSDLIKIKSQEDNEFNDMKQRQSGKNLNGAQKRLCQTHQPISPSNSNANTNANANNDNEKEISKRRIISLLNMSQQETTTDVSKSEQFESPSRLQIFIKTSSKDESNHEMLSTEKLTMHSQKQQQIFQAPIIFPLESHQEQNFSSAFRNNKQTKSLHQQAKSLNNRTQSPGKVQKYLSFYQQKINQEQHRFKVKEDLKKAQSTDYRNESQYQTLKQRNIQSPIVSEHYAQHNHESSQPICPPCISKLPPLKQSSQISPRYSIGYKNSTRHRQSTRESDQFILRDQEAVKSFLHKKLVNEGGLNFTMPSSPLDSQSFGNPFNLTKDILPLYAKKRRSSTSYEHTLQDISQKLAAHKPAKGTHIMAGIDFTINQAANSFLLQKLKNDLRQNAEINDNQGLMDLQGQKLKFSKKSRKIRQ